jgi:hypothetical protein
VRGRDSLRLRHDVGVGAGTAELVVDIAASPRPPRRALHLGFAIAVALLTVIVVLASFLMRGGDEERIGPPVAMSAEAVHGALRTACASAAAALAPADLVVTTATAYGILAKRRLSRLGDAASQLADVVPGPDDEADVVRVESAIASATTQARTALALAEAGDAAGARKALDEGAVGFAAACR